jgi:PASTA domain/IPT/TIG domain
VPDRNPPADPRSRTHLLSARRGVGKPVVLLSHLCVFTTIVLSGLTLCGPVADAAVTGAPPAVTRVLPTSGSIIGSRVTILGANFAAVTGVTFGPAPAAGFTVVNEGTLVASAPARPINGTIDVRVITQSGISPRVDTDFFTYTACIVPRLAGMNLRTAEERLSRADCLIGGVKTFRRASATSGRVIAQSVRPGMFLPPGSKVSVALAG